MENNIEVPEYIINSGEKLSVLLVGCGGTGGWVLGDLVALHHYLTETGRPGLHVTAVDPDVVTEANLGRQNFNLADLGEYKSVCLIEKYNRYWGLSWDAIGDVYTPDMKANIIISCVDSVAVRKQIIEGVLNDKGSKRLKDSEKGYFLLDSGNGYDYGQLIVTGLTVDYERKTFVDYFPNQEEKHDEPSCSVLESLGKQNLFINKFMANLTVNWLYTAIRTTEITNWGYFVNINHSLTPIYTL